MELMARYPDNYFDLAIVDPPYGINITNECMGGRKTIKPNKNKNWDNEVPTKEYFNELFRVSKNQIIWGGNYFELPVSRYFSIWDKGETMYGRDFAEAEFAWVNKGGTRIYKNSPNQLNRIHPTQKPVQLYKFCLDNYAKPGDKILDTHLGSGSIAIACHDYKFELTACELDKEYFNKAMERIKNHTNQTKLF
jgi:site-specific DNA-methyltransferase (adenine-specific)